MNSSLRSKGAPNLSRKILTPSKSFDDSKNLNFLTAKTQQLTKNSKRKQLQENKTSQFTKVVLEDEYCQKDVNQEKSLLEKQPYRRETSRSMKKVINLIKNLDFDRSTLTNNEIVQLVKLQHISIYQLENFLGKDKSSRCVEIRREFYKSELAELDRKDSNGVSDRAQSLNESQVDKLDYNVVHGACCENVIGHVKLPVGLAGPLILDKEEIYVPLATTEGCLVASTCRGLSALRQAGGVISCVTKDSMTRSPIVRFEDASLEDALNNVTRAIAWLNDKTNKRKVRAAFNSTTSHGNLIKYTTHPRGREIHIRFEAQTGDAMGMNICSKGVESALKEIRRSFPTMRTVTLSGNMCTDKKPSGINWILGRGKSVECNAEIPSDIVEKVFKVKVDALIDTWLSKVMIGSAKAASIGGFNCQAANIVSAIFIATGQDPAQCVTSSNCLLVLEKDSQGALVVTCSMPSIECGTVGGGTILPDQGHYLQMMGIKGSTPKQIESRQQSESSVNSSDSFESSCSQIMNNRLNRSKNAQTIESNSKKLAKIICATVMAAELSLLAALTDGTLVKSHMRHNRSSTNLRTVCQPF